MKKVLIFNLIFVLFFPFFARSSENPKNIIIMIGDGMGLSQISYEMMQNPDSSFNYFKDIGLVKTSSLGQEITDSAAAATAISTGVKVDNGFVALDKKNKSLKTIFELAKEKDFSTGFLVTSSVVHATPAAFYAHQKSRKLYEDIALDLVSSNVDFIVGGGTQFFNERSDKRDLFDEFEEKNYKIYNNQKSFLKSKNNEKALVLLAKEHLEKAQNKDKNSQIKLLEKTLSDLNSLNKPFILLVEGSQIDWGGHQNDENYLLEEMKEFDRLILSALKFVDKNQETLLIVTSDHESGGLVLASKGENYDFVYPKFFTHEHTGIMVPIFSYGKSSENFRGIYENNEIFFKMKELLKL